MNKTLETLLFMSQWDPSSQQGKIICALSIKIFYQANVYLLNVYLCNIYHKRLGNNEQICMALFFKGFLAIQ